MGYTVTVGSIKRAIVEQVGIVEISRARATTDTYYTVFQQDVDLSQVVNLCIGFDLSAGAGGIGYIHIEHNGVTLYDTDTPAGTLTTRFSKVVLVSGTTKVLGTFKIQLKNAVLGVNTNLYDMQIYATEA
jgi:hypothetical protein